MPRPDHPHETSQVNKENLEGKTRHLEVRKCCRAQFSAVLLPQAGVEFRHRLEFHYLCPTLETNGANAYTFQDPSL